MPNFNELKTTNPVYFPKPDGVKPAPKLDQADNAQDRHVDYTALLWAHILPTDDTASPPGALTVTASPFVHVAGTESECIQISGEEITAIEIYNEDDEEWIPLVLLAQATVILPPSGQLRVTYAGAAPSMVRMPGSFNNSAGTTEVIALTTSPVTLTASGRVMNFYVSGGIVHSIKLHDVALTAAGFGTFPVPRGGALVIEFDESDPPYVVRQS